MKLLMENWRNFVSDTEQSLLNEKKDRRRKFADDKGLDEAHAEGSPEYDKCVNRLMNKGKPQGSAERECGRGEPKKRSRWAGGVGKSLEENVDIRGHYTDSGEFIEYTGEKHRPGTPEFNKCMDAYMDQGVPMGEARWECGEDTYGYGEPGLKSMSRASRLGMIARGEKLEEDIELVDEGVMDKLKRIPKAVRRKLTPEDWERYYDSKFGSPTWKDLLDPRETKEELDEDIELYEEDDLAEGGKCTGPTKKASSTSKGKKWMQCVKNPDGKGYKRVHWGQKGVKVTGKSGDTKRKKSFRARHGCSTAKAGTPKAQACKDW